MKKMWIKPEATELNISATAKGDYSETECDVTVYDNSGKIDYRKPGQITEGSGSSYNIRVQD